MAQRRSELESRRRLTRVGPAAVTVVLVLMLVVVSGFGRSDGTRAGGPTSSATPLTALGASPSARSTTSPGAASPTPPASGEPLPTLPTDGPTASLDPTGSPSETPTGSDEPTPSTTPTATPSGPLPRGSAPISAKGFSFRRTIMPMAFPFAKSVSYRYRNNFLEARAGLPEWYNHWFLRNRDGTLKRAHDGVDIYARRGTHVLAPISGTVIDPRKHWAPWRPDRYGRVVVIESDERTSAGYVVILSHLDLAVVSYGAHVTRGQYVGTVGDTGNAQGTPQLHFEVRAPFTFAVTELGRRRQVDAFDPYPSIRRADPKARH
jgi:murein DD-endopeptidase MepM/ murein hydrolase activator NlpD